MNLFEDLNDSQKQAVSHIDGAMLILAGAGSGKNQNYHHSSCLSYR